MQLGEQTHEKGRQAVHRAKTWLERSTRVASSWTAYDDVASTELLQFSCPGDQSSAGFDIGGQLRGEELEHQSFIAEVKDYGPNSDQYPPFKKFLSLCYIAYTQKPKRCDHLMWITWRPFKSDIWDELTSITAISEAIVADRKRVFGPDVEAVAAQAMLDGEAVAAVSARLWLVVLSPAHETLVITKQHLAEVVRFITEKASL